MDGACAADFAAPCCRNNFLAASDAALPKNAAAGRRRQLREQH
jgi:hypothetical protein